MTRKKLLYIHGLSSSGASSTATHLKELLPDVEVISPDLPLDPDEALLLLKSICITQNPQLIIGSSMGGMFAQKLRGYSKILINPAFHVSQLMKREVGIHVFFNKRKDAATHYEITQQLADKYSQIEQNQFEHIDKHEQEITFGLFGRNDKTVNCLDEFRVYYTHYTVFEGEHGLTFDNIINDLLPLVNQKLELSV